jgi:hypothetical protein
MCYTTDDEKSIKHVFPKQVGRGFDEKVHF